MDHKRQNEEFFQVVKKFHEKEEYGDICVQHSALLPKLRPYQEKAVQWMIHREKQPVKENASLDLIGPNEETSSSAQFDRKLFVKRIPTGGILADEMGLGKTVEVLACIINNPRLGVEIPMVNNKSSELQVERQMQLDSYSAEKDPTVLNFVSPDKSLKTESGEEMDEKLASEIVIIQKENVTVKMEPEAGGCEATSRGDGTYTIQKYYKSIHQHNCLKTYVNQCKQYWNHEPLAWLLMGCCDITSNLDIMSDMSDPQVGHIKAESEDNANQVMVVEGSSTQLASIQKEKLTVNADFNTQETLAEQERKEEDFEEMSEMPLALRATMQKKNKRTMEMTEGKAGKRKGNTCISSVLWKKSKDADKSSVPQKKSKKADEFSVPQKKSKKADKSKASQKSPRKVSAVKQAADAWYASKLAEVNKNPIRAYMECMENNSVSDVQCICGEMDERDLVDCKNCSRTLHKICIGASKWVKSKPVYCPQCWLKNDLVQSRATLIVSPTSISSQWLSEVKNHISKDADFKILVYKGVKADGFSQPYDYADYDLILTTYEVLRRELVFTEVNEGRSRRYEKRYFSPTCPLICLDFWRICLDEAQMVEGTATKAAEMVSRLTCVHRWAVTGTPIQKALQDLYGLVMFLCVEPFCDSVEWRKLLFDPYCNGDKYPLFTVLAHIMWRSCKVDVLDQIQIPPQVEQIWWLNFTPVEEHFYHRTHHQCSNDFLERLLDFESLDVPLKSLKLTTVNSVLAPLLKLRQACSHPRAVRGNIIGCHKNTLTMPELLESLIKKTTMEAQEALRAHVASLNGMAGLHIVCHEYATAAEKYREVLRMTEEYKDRFKVDTLQRLHTYHNLAEIIGEHKDIIPPTLRDDSLREEASKLEEDYLSKAQSAVSSAKDSSAELTSSVQQLEEKMSDIDEGDWWIDISNTLAQIDEDELLRRVHDALLDNRKSIPDVTSGSIINKVSTLNGIKSLTLQWLDDIETNQERVRKSLKALQAAQGEALVDQAVNCHLRVSNLKSKTLKSKCQLCECESFLKRYEINLCAIKNKKQENIMVGDVYLLGQTKEGSWKPSEQETVLRTILSFGRTKKLNQHWLKAGATFIQLMDALRKELKQLRLLWSRINERTCARDELNMCKLRMRLRYPDEPSTSSTPSPHVNRRKRETKQLSSNIDCKTENLHVIEAHQVETLSFKMKLDAGSALSELRKKSGTVAYLQNLRNKGTDQQKNTELCPICRSTMEDRWAVLSCGHCYCMDCIPQLLNKTVNQRAKKQIQCAICREMTAQSEISFVNLNREEETDDDSSALDIEIPSIKGSLSTKIEAVVRRILYLRAHDPCVKILIFSNWETVLDVIEFAFEENAIKFVRLKSGASYEISLKKFKNMHEEETTTALLLPLKLGSKGLNLIEATHVFLVEPLLNPADELQAIGRVHRIGQTRATYVHRFLIKETIEERMFSAIQATGKEEWSGTQVTLRQLKDLFPNIGVGHTATNDHLS